jgi:hypothetical protein
VRHAGVTWPEGLSEKVFMVREEEPLIALAKEEIMKSDIREELLPK